MRPPALRSVLAAACVALSHGWAGAASRHADPDWPCPQRLVLTLSPGQFWSGPGLETAADWQQQPAVTTLVEKISPRKVRAEQGEAAIRDFVSGLGEDRARMVTSAFAGLLEDTNRQRAAIIEHIRGLARRQRELADIAERAGQDLNKIPPHATGEDAARRQDLEQRRVYVSRAFEDGQRTLRYACDVPVQLEARLGAYARALQAGLS
jgi:hypothetical protein